MANPLDTRDAVLDLMPARTGHFALEPDRLGVRFGPTERASTGAGGPYAATYRLPTALATRLPGQRVAIVDDVVNAGSAVRARILRSRMRARDNEIWEPWHCPRRARHEALQEP